jgi:hypothetical protein
MQTLTWNDRVIQWAPTWAHAAEREVPAWEVADKALRSIAKRRAALDAWSAVAEARAHVGGERSSTN